jgi:hypothetical protein
VVRGGAFLALAGLALAATLASGSRASGSAPTTRFVSQEYGYVVLLPGAKAAG